MDFNLLIIDNNLILYRHTFYWTMILNNYFDNLFCTFNEKYEVESLLYILCKISN